MDSLSQHGKRTTHIRVRLTPEERFMIRAKANQHGLTVSEYLRRLLLDDRFRREHAGYEGPLTRELKKRQREKSGGDR